MVNLGQTKREDRSKATKYLTVGRALHRTAKDLGALAERKYGNGLAIGGAPAWPPRLCAAGTPRRGRGVSNRPSDLCPAFRESGRTTPLGCGHGQTNAR